MRVICQQQNTGNKPRLVCKQAIFPADRGTTENSLSAVGHSLIAENNFGYQGPYENIAAEPGLARIDINTDGKTCALAWENREISSPSAVPKVSLANGLIYLYTRGPGNDPALQAWYFTAVDFETGELVYKVLTGIGPGYNNHYGSMTLAQDGTMVVGVLQGVVSVRDGGGAAKPWLATVFSRVNSSATGRNNILAIPVDLFDLLRHCIDIGLAGVDIAKRNNGLVDTNVL